MKVAIAAHAASVPAKGKIYTLMPKLISAQVPFIDDGAGGRQGIVSLEGCARRDQPRFCCRDRDR